MATTNELKAVRKQLNDMIRAYEFMRDEFNLGTFDSVVETDSEKKRAASIYDLCLQDAKDALALLEKVE